MYLSLASVQSNSSHAHQRPEGARPSPKPHRLRCSCSCSVPLVFFLLGRYLCRKKEKGRTHKRPRSRRYTPPVHSLACGLFPPAGYGFSSAAAAAFVGPWQRASARTGAISLLSGVENP